MSRLHVPALNNIPNYIWTIISRYLEDSYQSFFRVGKTCKHLSRLCQDRSFLEYITYSNPIPEEVVLYAFGKLSLMYYPNLQFILIFDSFVHLKEFSVVKITADQSEKFVDLLYSAPCLEIVNICFLSIHKQAFMNLFSTSSLPRRLRNLLLAQVNIQDPTSLKIPLGCADLMLSYVSQLNIYVMQENVFYGRLVSAQQCIPYRSQFLKKLVVHMSVIFNFAHLDIRYPYLTDLVFNCCSIDSLQQISCILKKLGSDSIHTIPSTLVNISVINTYTSPYYDILACFNTCFKNISANVLMDLIPLEHTLTLTLSGYVYSELTCIPNHMRHLEKAFMRNENSYN
ncbi:MAG: hypothetical protein Sylvanvirus21_11 [Sylvanvirus sp.]|uniref:F-box domain-containing protein n=1 Tax=Sylvanvirus sp. TaxID=2487774 RepID=A0A3G5AM15_9VIRU|nr:MAG: hypothetical protein Sylvanvirus21_11 [Sylvanvirus sp.]